MIRRIAFTLALVVMLATCGVGFYVLALLARVTIGA